MYIEGVYLLDIINIFSAGWVGRALAASESDKKLAPHICGIIDAFIEVNEASLPVDSTDYKGNNIICSFFNAK